MKITVDLADFWNEDDEASLSESIKNTIAYQVKNQILSELKDRIKTEITNSVKSEIESELSDGIKEKVKDVIKNVKLKKYGSSDEEFTVEEWILGRFIDKAKSQRFTNDFEGVAENAIKSLRKSYDLNFASQIVVKMSDQGLLKDGMAELLIDKK